MQDVLPFIGFHCESSHATRVLDYIMSKYSAGLVTLQGALVSPDLVQIYGLATEHLISVLEKCNGDEILFRFVSPSLFLHEIFSS